jgi:hypothetical protein
VSVFSHVRCQHCTQFVSAGHYCSVCAISRGHRAAKCRRAVAQSIAQPAALCRGSNATDQVQVKSSRRQPLNSKFSELQRSPAHMGRSLICDTTAPQCERLTRSTSAASFRAGCEERGVSVAAHIAISARSYGEQRPLDRHSGCDAK